jgi:WD40 repeat protein
MKPIRNALASAMKDYVRRFQNNDYPPLRSVAFLSRSTLVLALLLLLAISANAVRLAGAAEPVGAFPQITKSTEPSSAEKKDTATPPATNPRGEALLFEPASTTIQLTGSTLWAAVLTPDGKSIVTAQGNYQGRGEVRIWDRETEKIKQTIPFEKGVRAVAFSPDGKVLVSSCYDGVVRFHDPKSFATWAVGDESSGGHQANGVNGICFFKGGKYLATAGFDNTIRIWDVLAILAARRNGETIHVPPVAVLQGHTQTVLSVAGSEDGRTLLSGGMDKTARAWDLPAALPKMGEKPLIISKERKSLGGHSANIEGIAVSPDGKLLVTSAWGGLLLVRDWEGSNVLFRHQFPGGVMCATFSRDGKYLAVGCGVQENPRAREVLVWEVETKTIVANRLDFEEGVKGLEFTPDGKSLIVAVATQIVHVWPWAEPKDKQVLNPPKQTYTPQALFAAAISPNGSLLAFSGDSQSIFVYNRTEGKIVAELTGHEDVVAGLSFSPDGKTMASASYDKTIKLWNTDSWKERKSLTGHTGWVFGIAFSPDGQSLASGSYDKTLRIWDVETGVSKEIWKDHSAGVRSVAYSPDGKKLVSGGSDRILRVWDVENGKVLLSLKGHKSAVRSVAFSTDGKFVASGSEDRTVKLWNAESGKETKTFTDLPDMITAIRYSPKAQSLAVATFQGTIALLDPITGHLRQSLRGHNDSATAVVFADGGKTVLSVSQDQTIRQWKAIKTEIAIPAQTLIGKVGIIAAAAINPSGTAAALANTEGSIVVWEPKTGKLIPFEGDRPEGISQLAISNEMLIAVIGKDNTLLVSSIDGRGTWKGKGSFAAFTPDGKSLAVANGKEIVLHDAATGKEVKRFVGGHDGNVVQFAFSPDGSRLISAGQETKVRLWNVSNAGKLQETPAFGNESVITHLTFSPDGNRFAVSAYGPDQPPPEDMTGMFRAVREVRIYTVPKSGVVFANPIVFTPQPADQPISGLHWTGNGQTLVMPASDGTVRIAELGANGAPEKQRFRAHEAAVLASAVSAEGGVFITAGEDMAVRQWRLSGVEPALGRARLISSGLSRVWSILPSNDGKYVVTAGEGDKTFRVYAGIPSCIPVEQDSYSAVLSLAFSPDNRFLVTGHDKGIVVIREAATGKPIRTLTGLSSTVFGLAFADNGTAVVASSGNWNNPKDVGGAIVWDFPEGKVRHVLDDHTPHTMINIHPDGKRAAIAGTDGKVRMWDVINGKQLTTFGNGEAVLRAVAFDRAGTRIAAGGYDHTVRVWDVESGEELRTFSTASLIPTKVLFSPDGKEIVISAWLSSGQPQQKPSLTAYSLDDMSASPRQFETHPASVMSLEFLPDEKTLIASGGETNGLGSIRMYDFATAKYLGQFSGHKHWAQTIAISTDGKHLASTSWSVWSAGELRLWDPRGFQPIAEIKVPGENQYISSGAIGLDGKLLVLGGWGQTLTAWDMTDASKPELRKQFKEHKAGIRSVAFDEAGKRFVSADEGGTVIVWDAETLERIVSFKASDHGIYRAKFTPDGTKIVTVGGDWKAQTKSEMRVWDSKSGKDLGRFPDQPREVWDIAFLDGGKLLATLPAFSGGQQDAHVKIWDFEKKVVMKTLLPPGTFNNGRCLGLSPDGKRLAIGSNNGPVKVLDTTSWKEVLNFPDLTNCTFQVDFTRDSKNLLIASGEGAAISIRLPE